MIDPLHCKLCLCCTAIHCLLLLNVYSQSNHCALFGAHKHIIFECFWFLSNHTNLHFCCWRWLLIFVSPFWEDTCGTHFVCVWNTCWAWKWNEWVVVQPNDCTSKKISFLTCLQWCCLCKFLSPVLTKHIPNCYYRWIYRWIEQSQKEVNIY